MIELCFTLTLILFLMGKNSSMERVYRRAHRSSFNPREEDMPRNEGHIGLEIIQEWYLFS